MWRGKSFGLYLSVSFINLVAKRQALALDCASLYLGLVSVSQSPHIKWGNKNNLLPGVVRLK